MEYTIPNDITCNTSPSVNIFKTHLDNGVKKKPIYNYCGSRKRQILYARLRQLNKDLLDKNIIPSPLFFDKHIIPSPLCQCGEIEPAIHFLLFCPLYQALMRQHISTLQLPDQLTSNLLLLESDEYNYEN